MVDFVAAFLALAAYLLGLYIGRAWTLRRLTEQNIIEEKNGKFYPYRPKNKTTFYDDSFLP